MRKFKAPWVDPAEKLPRLGESVLICREFTKDELVVEQAWLTPQGWWKVFGTNCKRIIAWRPMPEAPEVNES